MFFPKFILHLLWFSKSLLFIIQSGILTEVSTTFNRQENCNDVNMSWLVIYLVYK